MWTDKTTGKEAPEHLFACDLGTYLDASTNICRSCPPGQYSNISNAPECIRCPKGTRSENALRCVQCQPGYAAAESGLSSCTACPLGTFAAGNGSAECKLCHLGSYGENLSSTSCSLCETSMTTAFMGATKPSDCLCKPDSYLHHSNDTACTPCKEGMECGLGSDMRNYWDAKSRGFPKDEEQWYPMLLPRYWSYPHDPLSVFR